MLNRSSTHALVRRVGDETCAYIGAALRWLVASRGDEDLTPDGMQRSDEYRTMMWC